jgi:NAD(P)H-hydrate epimerase
MQVLTREQVRQVDRLAIVELGIPGVVLMENAGRRAAEVVLGVLRDGCGPEPQAGRVVILCGGGNNGGDGYVIARHLQNQAVAVTVFAITDPARLTGDAAVNYNICEKMGLTVCRIESDEQLHSAAKAWAGAAVIVDALLGTGFTGTVRPRVAAVIERCNAVVGAKIVAVDVPSGLDCDTGQPSNATVRADVTVTFVAPKPGFGVALAGPYVGEVIVAGIGVPPGLIDRVLSQSVDGQPRMGENA